MRLPALPLGEAGVGLELGPADQVAERLELLLLVGGDVERAGSGRNAPDGAAVKLSLPFGSGLTFPIR